MKLKKKKKKVELSAFSLLIFILLSTQRLWQRPQAKIRPQTSGIKIKRLKRFGQTGVSAITAPSETRGEVGVGGGRGGGGDRGR